MRNKLYVANLSANVTEEQLRMLFGEQGEVAAVEWGVEPKTGEPCALVEMATEKTATKALNTLNGQRLDERLLLVSYPDADLERPLLPKQQKAAEEIAAALGESDEKPLRQLTALVRLCGISFAQALLKWTEEVEARGGILRDDGEGQRSKGGVFFYEGRFRVTLPVRRIVYGRHGKFPKIEAAMSDNPDVAAVS